MLTNLKAAGLLLLSLGLCSTASASSITCMNFEGYPLGATYAVGATQTVGTITGEFIAFQWDDGTWTPDGLATISGTNLARGSGQEINLNNINLRFLFGAFPSVATFRYADHGGNVNLGVNGILNNVGDLSDLDGVVVGGVLILVTRTDLPTGHYGVVTLVGQASDIERFAAGGQEFWADEICVTTL